MVTLWMALVWKLFWGLQIFTTVKITTNTHLAQQSLKDGVTYDMLSLQEIVIGSKSYPIKILSKAYPSLRGEKE